MFVSYEISKLLNQKGFVPTLCGAYQTQENNRLISHLYNRRDFDIAPHLLPAPLYQQVVDWLLEKHNIFIEIKVSAHGGFDYRIVTNRTVNMDVSKSRCIDWSTPTNALNRAIEEALNLL